MVSLKQLIGLELEGKDGVAGRVSDYLIDERTWSVGYAAVPVGGLFSSESRPIPVATLNLDADRSAVTSSRSLRELAAMSPVDVITKEAEGIAAVGVNSAPRPVTVPPEPESPWRSFTAMLGSNISASDGIYGSLQDLLVELDTWSIQYFVGHSYQWKKKSSVLIPTAWVHKVSWRGETVEVTASKAALEREPSYKPASHTQAN